MPRTVCVVEDDTAMRETIGQLLRSVGYDVRLFADTTTFLDQLDGTAGCVILDVRLPGASGLQAQRSLNDVQSDLSIVFISGQGDVEIAVRAMKEGAVDFLQKPFHEQELLDAVHDALGRHEERRRRDVAHGTAELAYRSLTPVEREVMAYVATGLMNKQIAGVMGRSEHTIKIHRGRVMRKMQARTVVEIARLADQLSISSRS